MFFLWPVCKKEEVEAGEEEEEEEKENKKQLDHRLTSYYCTIAISS